jgi:transglutaminase-like putative cysteine protease
VRSVDGWRLRIEHVTNFVYSAPARASYNEVRQTPLSNGHQTTLEAAVTTAPSVAHNSYSDYWGTHVVYFNVDAPHEHLTIRSRALVETRRAAYPADLSWSDVDAQADRLYQYLVPSRYTAASPSLRDAALALRTSTPRGTVRAVSDWVNGTLDYVSGVTSVHTSAAEAFDAGRGVCQDFAHLAIAVLRAAGVPTRYVSGYLHPDQHGETGEATTGESQAWVEAWLGGWWGLDPTNATQIGERHVSVARGRDYADVAPVKGVFAGRAQHSTDVAVSITRVA